MTWLRVSNAKFAQVQLRFLMPVSNAKFAQIQLKLRMLWEKLLQVSYSAFNSCKNVSHCSGVAGASTATLQQPNEGKATVTQCSGDWSQQSGAMQVPYIYSPPPPPPPPSHSSKVWSQMWIIGRLSLRTQVEAVCNKIKLIDILLQTESYVCARI